jgi:hypothetical protein
VGSWKSRGWDHLVIAKQSSVLDLSAAEAPNFSVTRLLYGACTRVGPNRMVLAACASLH